MTCLSKSVCVSVCVWMCVRAYRESPSCFVLAPLCDLYVWPLTPSWPLGPSESLFVFVILPTVSCATAPSTSQQGDATKPTLTALEEGHSHGRHAPSALGEYTHTTLLLLQLKLRSSHAASSDKRKLNEQHFRPIDVDLLTANYLHRTSPLLHFLFCFMYSLLLFILTLLYYSSVLNVWRKPNGILPG